MDFQKAQKTQRDRYAKVHVTHIMGNPILLSSTCIGNKHSTLITCVFKNHKILELICFLKRHGIVAPKMLRVYQENRQDTQETHKERIIYT